MLGDNVALTLLGGGKVATAESINGMVGSLDWPGAAAMASIVCASLGRHARSGWY
jgi:hypothetical protein